MRWPRLFRRRAVGRHAAAGGPEPVVPSAPAHSVTLPDAAMPATSVPATVEPKRASVRLGFSDGTSLEIDDESGDSEALRATVARLLGPVDSATSD